MQLIWVNETNLVIDHHLLHTSQTSSQQAFGLLYILARHLHSNLVGVDTTTTAESFNAAALILTSRKFIRNATTAATSNDFL